MDAVTDDLLVGDLRDAADHDALRERGVETVVKLTGGEPERPYPEDLTVHRVPVADGTDHDRDAFAAGVRRTLAALEAGETTLVHCRRGVSRTGAVAGTALACLKDIHAGEGIDRVQAARPRIQPHPDLLTTALAVRELLG
jgi:protein-tyrosine phosphatase